MAEFWFLFICNMLVPVTMLVLGYLFKGIHFPKDVNAFCGYRTSMSMKNEKTWKFANAYWGKICWRIGWGVALVTAFATILLISQEKKYLIRHRSYFVWDSV